MLAQILSLSSIAFMGAFGIQDGTSQRLVTVYVANGTDGLTTSGGGDSAIDLTKALRHKQKTLRLVPSPSGADVVVRVTSRNEVKELGTTTSFSRKSDDGQRKVATTTPTQNTRRIVHATIKAGDFETELQGESVFWGGAADNLAGQIDHWTKQNYSRLIEKRFQTNGDAEQARKNAAPLEHGSSEPATEISIQPGMTPQEVTDKMGEPLKKMAFGQKSLWTYKGCQIVFENNKVTDVKF